MSQTFLEVRNLVKIFGKLTAVDNVSFKVEQGEVVTLLGPSGCGKTTTLRMVAGFEKPNGGEVEIAGRVVVATNRRINVPPEKRDIGMVFQSYAIWPHMTVFENVAFPLNVRRANRQEIKRRVEETLELVGLANFSDRPAILLSGGQQQRVSLARALVYSPSILLLDEPLSNLDAKLREQMRIEIKRLQQQLGFTVLFVTHDQIEAMSLSTRLALMNQGRIEQIGAPQDVYEHPQTPFVEDFLGSILRFRGKIVEKRHGFDVIEFDGLKDVQVRVPESVDGAAIGERVLVAIRPEDTRIESSDSDNRDNVIPCEVENILHLGRELELVLRVGGRVCTLTVPRERGMDRCRTIGLHVPPEHLRVWVTDAELESDIETGSQASSRRRSVIRSLPLAAQLKNRIRIMAKVSTADGISQPRLLSIEPATICIAVLFARGGVFGPDAAFVAAGGQLSTCQTRRSSGLRSGRLAPRLYRPVDPRSLVEHGVARRRAPGDRAGDRRPALLVDCPHRSAVEKSPGVHVLDFVLSAAVAGHAGLDLTSRRQVRLAQPMAAEPVDRQRSDFQYLFLLGHRLGAYDDQSRRESVAVGAGVSQSRCESRRERAQLRRQSGGYFGPYRHSTHDAGDIGVHRIGTDSLHGSI